MKKTLIASLILSLTLPVSALAGGGGFIPVDTATLAEQVVQEITAISQLLQQVTMVQNNLQNLQNQARNLQSLPSQMWPNISSNLQSLVSIIGQAHGISYASSNVAALVQQQYGDTSQLLPNYEHQLQGWTANSNSQIAATLKGYGIQSAGMPSEQSALQSIENASQSSAGRLQALQAGNQIAGLQVNQLQNLRATIINGNQTMLNIQANHANAKQQDRNVLNKMIGSQPHYGW